MYYILLYCIALHCIDCIVLYCIVLHYIALHCIVLYYTALHFIELYWIALHCIVTLNIPFNPPHIYNHPFHPSTVLCVESEYEYFSDSVLKFNCIIILIKFVLIYPESLLNYCFQNNFIYGGSPSMESWLATFIQIIFPIFVSVCIFERFVFRLFEILLLFCPGL